MATRTLVIGEALIDVVHHPVGEVVEHVGGSPTNVAIGLARLGHPVELATHVGDDDRGRRIADALAAEGVTLTPGSGEAARTPTATATLDAAGSATYDFDLAWQMPRVPTDASHLHTGSIAGVLEPGASAVLEAVLAARPHATISYDPNLRPSLMGPAHDVRAKVEQLIGLSDVVKASDEDIAWLYAGAPLPDVVRLWGRLGPELIVVTRGGDGAVVNLPRTGDTREVEAPRVEVADSVGAGDSFMSGLLSGLLDDGLLGRPDSRQRLASSDPGDLLPAVQRGIDASAITVSRAGANPPTRAELP